MIVDADASLTGAGCVLSQIQDGKERVIAYHSHAFSREERNYCVTRRELLCVVIALKHFEPYLLFRKFAVRTDHSSLRWLQTLRYPEQQLFRWLAVLQTFDFEIYHRAGKLHQNCNSLSCRPCEENCKHCSRHEQVGNHKIEDKDCLDVVHAYLVWREHGDLLVGLTGIFHEIHGMMRQLAKHNDTILISDQFGKPNSLTGVRIQGKSRTTAEPRNS